MTDLCDITAMSDALAALYVRSDLLSPDERSSLDLQGFVLMQGLIDDAWLQELRLAFEGILSSEGRNVGHDYQQEEGALRIGNLVNKGDVFDRVWTHPRYLAAIHHIIRDEFNLESLSGREPLPKWQGRQQGLHLDGGPANTVRELVDSVWMLDDFTATNGATRLIPGSHLWPQAPWDVMDCCDDHPQQIMITAPAGSVLVFNGRLWHSGTLNRDGTRRRALFPYMKARHAGDKGAYQRKHLLKSTWDRLSPAARYILGV